jgi:predicted RND superfamily exporter protein
MDYVAFLDALETRLAGILGPDLPFTVTGSVALSSRGFSVLLGSLVRSYALALAVISPLMVLLLSSVRRGLLAMIPNVLPVYLTLALMGIADVPMNISTLLMGSVVIGLAVDDTIHFAHHFDRACARGLDPRAAVHETFASVGPALSITSVVLAGSFVVMLLAEFVGVYHFGLLVTFAVVVAFFSDVLLAPALLVLDAEAHATGAQSHPRQEPSMGHAAKRGGVAGDG